jgi:hypothetical protein
MADFDKAFRRVFGDHVRFDFPLQNNVYQHMAQPLKRSANCWSKMKGLGFTNREISNYLRCYLCKEVWSSILGDQIDYQPLAESMFTFSLVNGSDQCLYLLNSSLKLKGGLEYCERTIKNANRIDGDEILQRFGIAKIMYYDLSSKYLAHQGMEVREIIN